MLEWVNRARMDPLGEIERMRSLDDAHAQSAYAYFLVDLDVFAADMTVFQPQPPLAFDARLIDAARGHSQWMFDNVTQSHVQGSIDIGDRATAAGYPWLTLGENIFSYAHSVPHAHAGFEVDWGLLDPVTGEPIPPGMQDPPGHRLTNHSESFREAGVGIVLGRNERMDGDEVVSVGPMVVTMKFADRISLPPLVTGVVYYDVNDNEWYDLGEGLGGIRIEVVGGTHEAFTSRSGGYAVPGVAGDSVVRFWAGGTLIQETQVHVPNAQNVKLDLKLEYEAPRITADGPLRMGQSNVLQPTAFLGATDYAWERLERTLHDSILGAEPGDTGFELLISPEYSGIQSARTVSGQFAFQLAMPEPEDQTINITHRLLGREEPTLNFFALLAAATENQRALAEISVDEGLHWAIVWEKVGTGFPGDAGFEAVSVPLPQVANREFLARFRYAFQVGSFFPQTTEQAGFFLDNVQWSDVDTIRTEATGQVGVLNSIVFEPDHEGVQWWRVRPLVGDRSFPWGNLHEFEILPADDTPDEIRISGITRLSSGLFRITGTTHLTVDGMVLLVADELGGEWSQVANFELLDFGNGQFQVEWPSMENQAWYRIGRP